MTAPELTDLAETTTAVIRGVIPVTELVGFFDRSFPRLAAVLGEQGITPTGAAFARYFGPPGEQADLEVGFPTDGTVTDTGDVRAGSLPSGRAARLLHAGGYDTLGASWERLGAWVAEQGLTPGGDLWEVYVTEPDPEMDPADLRTELHWSIRPS